MITISNFVFGGLLLIGIVFWVACTYVILWRMAREKDNRDKLSWLTMLYASMGTFCLLLSWRVVEPLAKDFVPVFLVLSLVVGFFFRESAISPYRLADYWLRLGSRSSKNRTVNTNHKNKD